MSKRDAQRPRRLFRNRPAPDTGSLPVPIEAINQGREAREALAREIDTAVDAYHRALPAGESVPPEILQVAEQCARDLFGSGRSSPILAIHRAAPPWETAEPGADPVADVIRLCIAETQLTELVIRASGTSEAEHSRDPHRITVVTARWVVSATPIPDPEPGFRPDVMAWSVSVVPRSRHVIMLE
jgi:hypothetical protein